MCPFVDHADPRCAAHLTLRNIFRAFLHCADRYKDCPVHRLLAEAHGHNCEDARVALLAAS